MINSKSNAPRHDFPGLDAGLGPARQLSPVDTEWIVGQIVGRALRSTSKPRPRLWSLRSLSLAALAIVTSAAAATVVHQVRKSVATTAPAVAGPQRQPQTKPPRRAPPPATSEAIPEPTEVPEIVGPTRELAPSSLPNSAARTPSASDQLSAANVLRRSAKWAAAEAAYSAVAARYSGTQDGYVAQLAAAELRLGHLGDPRGALRLYQALPRDNPLGVEALFGVSRAHRALLDRTAEMAALRLLIEAYPTSLQADGARARLKQLVAQSEIP